MGATVVAGLEFELGRGAMLVEGRYTHGFSNIADSGTEEVRNRAFGLFAGYAIRFR